MRDFHRLLVWEKSHQLTLEIYRITETFPSNEQYGLVSQLRRCCASIPSNVAEGAGRSTDVEFARFIDIAAGSANEVEYQILLARDLKFIGAEAYEELNTGVNEVKKMLAALSRKLRDVKPSPLNANS
jgi:four helix bundle protein